PDHRSRRPRRCSVAPARPGPRLPSAQAIAPYGAGGCFGAARASSAPPRPSGQGRGEPEGTKCTARRRRSRTTSGCVLSSPTATSASASSTGAPASAMRRVSTSHQRDDDVPGNGHDVLAGEGGSGAGRHDVLTGEGRGEGPGRGNDKMPVEFKVTVQDTPGTLARLGRILGEARVNIEAIQGTSREGKGFIQFVPNDEDKAAHILDAAGIPTASAKY